MVSTPVVSVKHFQGEITGPDFYISSLKPHIKAHAITKVPHKHDFYFVVLFTGGTGVHEVDFVKHPVRPGDLFVMRPGQMHVWELSKDAEGFVIIHTGPFYEEGIQAVNVSEQRFFIPFMSSPVLHLKKGQIKRVESIIKDMLDEYTHERKYKIEKIRVLLSSLYIEMARSQGQGPAVSGQRYLDKLRQFEDLLNENYRHLHLPSEYAERLNVSERHLNRIIRSALGKSSSEVIHEKLILEAKRKLTQANVLIADVAESLGFNDQSYFSRFFARETGLSPRGFVRLLHRG